MKNNDFQERKMVAVRRFLNKFIIFDGGDLRKNDDFKNGKMVAVRRTSKLLINFNFHSCAMNTRFYS